MGPSIHFQHEAFSGGEKHQDSVGQAVGLARMMLRDVLGSMAKGLNSLTDRQREHLDYYFVLKGTPMSANDFQIVQQSLTLVNNGINGANLGVKVTVAGSAMGYVNLHKVKDSGKKGWTRVVDVRNKFEKTNYGTIHLDTDRLETGPALSAKTFIHEAGHKFASLDDWGAAGYISDETGKFRDTDLAADKKLTAGQAINNAESYARFVMHAFMDR